MKCDWLECASPATYNVTLPNSGEVVPTCLTHARLFEMNWGRYPTEAGRLTSQGGALMPAMNAHSGKSLEQIQRELDELHERMWGPTWREVEAQNERIREAQRRYVWPHLGWDRNWNP